MKQRKMYKHMFNSSGHYLGAKEIKDYSIVKTIMYGIFIVISIISLGYVISAVTPTKNVELTSTHLFN
jgi:hypothetical protein